MVFQGISQFMHSLGNEPLTLLYYLSYGNVSLVVHIMEVSSK